MQNVSDQRDYSNKDKIIFFNEKLQPDLRFKLKVLTPIRKINRQLSTVKWILPIEIKTLLFVRVALHTLQDRTITWLLTGLKKFIHHGSYF